MRIAVLGGAGRLGAWISRTLKKMDIEVVVSTPNPEKYSKIIQDLHVKAYADNETAVTGADGVIISVPLHETIKVIKQVLPYLKPNSFIVEVSSIKKPVEEFIEEYGSLLRDRHISLLSAHPMFGPGAKSLRKKNIIIIPNTYNREIFEKTKKFLKSEGANVVECTYKDHDLKIAFTLGLPHLLLMLFTATISILETPDELDRYSGTTFKILKTLSESLLSESWELYSHIQMDNTHTNKILELFKTQLNKLINIVENRDTEKFREFWESNVLKLKSNTNPEESYRKIYKFLDKI